jgi:hypothetical protein
VSSWDRSGRNDDFWTIEAGERRLLADLEGPGAITHLWLTQQAHYRDCLLLITWDNATEPSVAVPLGDFFCLGHGLVNSFQSALFSASTGGNYRFREGCALNCYVQMPFRHRVRVELLNESAEPHLQYFYVDYERWPNWPEEMGYFHAEFRRANPFPGWGPEVPINSPQANVVNAGEVAWANNYFIVDTQGEGHYIGCNLSVANLTGGWWGEGDDMIWVDGYKWPPDLHGTGSEDYLGHAWGMQANAFLRNGSSIFEPASGGYQSSYVFHLENPVRFTTSLRVTIEHGHANHLANDMSSVGYWYARRPAAAVAPPPVELRQPVLRDNQGRWLVDAANQGRGRAPQMTAEMIARLEA